MDSIERAARDAIQDKWTTEKWRAMCVKVAGLPKSERETLGMLEHEVKLVVEDDRVDLAIQSIRERLLCSFARAADIYRDWQKSR